LTRRDFLIVLAGVLTACSVNNREPDYTIVIHRDTRFQPSSLVVPPGTMIAWQHRGESVHTVTADPEKSQAPDRAALPAGVEPFDSGDLFPGDRWAHTFDTPGSYFYFCRYHELEEMFGVIVVTAPE
jgi:plastocyanin